MFGRIEAKGQQLAQINCAIGSVGTDHIDHERFAAELPHHLPAYAAGRKFAGNNAILAAADGNGGKITVSIVDCLKKGGAFGAVCGAVGGIFDVAALVYGTVGAKQRRAHLVAGIGHISMLHGLHGQLA